MTVQQQAAFLRSGKPMLVLAMFLVLNGAYLAAFGSPNIFYVANALLHPLLGMLVAVLFWTYFFRHRNLFAGWVASGAIILLSLTAGLGLYLAVAGMTRSHSLALYAHVFTVIIGLLLLLIHLGRQTRLAPGSSDLRSVWRVSLAVMLGSLAFYGVAASYQRFFPNPRYMVVNPRTAPVSMYQEGRGQNYFTFPSSSETVGDQLIPSEFIMNSESCKRCHADIYKQWNSSMHHFASFNNQWYRKSIEYMQDTIGVKPSLWCAGCHDHALSFAGKMQRQPIREIVHTPEAQAGLGCTSCHAMVQVKDTMGQGGFVIEYPALDRFTFSGNRFLQGFHDYTVKLNPKPHRNVFLKRFHKVPEQTPGFCSACHKVHLDVPVNNYRWIRGFDDYDNWQASGVSGQGARSFYYPPAPLPCADCHMPLVRSQDFGNINGFVHSHRFAAANTAIPTSHDDQEQIREVEKFLKGAVSVDIFALAEETPEKAVEAAPGSRPSGAPQISSTFAVGEESAAGLAASEALLLPAAKLAAPLNRGVARLRRGETVRVEVVVRTRKLGHFFPGGTVDAFDVWVELVARDDKGHIVFWSGKVEDDGRGPVEPGAHFYRSLQLDAHGNMINKRNAWATRAAMYARLIPPGAADSVHFRLKLPEDCGNHITLQAKVNYRKFSWWNTQWAFAGIPAPTEPGQTASAHYDDRPWVFRGDLSGVSAKSKQIPNVPIVVVAENEITVPVVPKDAPPFAEKLALDAGDRERWNDYGIGLLLQGDLRGAERAFLKVTELESQYADGWVNVGRARVLEGNTEAAKPVLQKALALNPGLASAHYYYGLALKADGNYAEAYAHFARAADRYPLDRVVRNQMGRMLFLQRKYREAVAEFAKTLAVDPEDLEAHYNLMLCYSGLGDREQAAREEKLYLRFKADESARAITGPSKLAHPEDNNEAQLIHEHVSATLKEASPPKGYPAVSQSSSTRRGGN